MRSSLGNYRALFYRGLICRLQNRLDDAVRDLQLVANEYPRFRQVRQELGYAFFLLKQYRAAREQFEALLDINPDDLAAHYYLSQIYRQLGMPAEANHEGAIYSEHKDDPGAALLALHWRDKHPDIAHENEPYHVHSNSSTKKVIADANGPWDSARPKLFTSGRRYCSTAYRSNTSATWSSTTKRWPRLTKWPPWTA